MAVDERPDPARYSRRFREVANGTNALDGLSLPLIAVVGFDEVLVVMLALVWLAGRYARAHAPVDAA